MTDAKISINILECRQSREESRGGSVIMNFHDASQSAVKPFSGTFNSIFKAIHSSFSWYPGGAMTSLSPPPLSAPAPVFPFWGKGLGARILQGESRSRHSRVPWRNSQPDPLPHGLLLLLLLLRRFLPLLLFLLFHLLLMLASFPQ